MWSGVAIQSKILRRQQNPATLHPHSGPSIIPEPFCVEPNPSLHWRAMRRPEHVALLVSTLRYVEIVSACQTVWCNRMLEPASPCVVSQSAGSELKLQYIYACDMVDVSASLRPNASANMPFNLRDLTVTWWRQAILGWTLERHDKHGTKRVTFAFP